MSDFNEQIIKEFRANEGKVGGHFADMELLLLHTTGAKSGKPRLNPTAFIRDGERLVIAASKGGADTHPDWYYNLLANPEVNLEVGKESFSARAKSASEPGRSELYAKLASKYPGFAEYQGKTKRVIPVVMLTCQ